MFGRFVLAYAIGGTDTAQEALPACAVCLLYLEPRRFKWAPGAALGFPAVNTVVIHAYGSTLVPWNVD